MHTADAVDDFENRSLYVFPRDDEDVVCARLQSRFDDPIPKGNKSGKNALLIYPSESVGDSGVSY